jgi:phosphonate transport system substrate-binding protein
MIDRRQIVGGFILSGAAVLFAATIAQAQDYKAKYPELTFAVVPAENASGVIDRWTPFADYLSKQLGVKVTLRVANDYAAVIEGQRAGNIQIAYYGPASFSRARVTGVKTDAFAIDVNSDGSKGYYSVFYVLAKSPYQKLEDLKGKNLGLVDPNSTSGNNMPRFKMNQMGVSDAETYFGKVVFTGSHENAVLALAQGTVDVAANWWNADDDSNLTRMLSKGMVKNTDGTLMKKEDFRIIVKSDLIINSPYAYLTELPDDLKAAIRKAFFDAAKNDKAMFDKLSDGKNRPWEPITNADYDKTIELITFVDNLRKKAS